MSEYSIKEASKLTGLPASTLRYYESVGIIQPIERDGSSKHRVYSQRDLDVLDTIACLNATGMRLDDMRAYIGNLNDSEEHATDQKALLDKQYEHLLYEEQHLQLKKHYVKLKVEYWQAVEAGDTERVDAIALEAKQLTKALKRI